MNRARGGSTKAPPKRIQIVTTYFPPDVTGIAPYVGDIVASLTSSGHEVGVLTTASHYPHWSYREKPSLIAIDRGRSGRSRETRVRVLLPKHHTVRGRGMYEASFLALGIAALPLQKRADVVMAVIPGLAAGWLGWMCARVWRSPFVLNVQDLSAQGAVQFGVTRSGGTIGALGRIEGGLLHSADRLVVPGPAFGGHLKRYGVDSSRIETVRNWSRLGAPTRSSADTRTTMGWTKSDIVVLHAGNMGAKQQLTALGDYARAAREMGLPLRFVALGDGNKRAEVERVAAANVNLDVVDPVDEAKLASVLNAADVLLLHEAPTVIDAALPSKLTSYFAAGRPIFGVTAHDGAAAQEIERAGTGVIASVREPGQVAKEIFALSNDPEARAIASRGPAYVATELNAADRLKQLHQILLTTDKRRTHGEV